jgi:hypothetical protein
MEDAEARVPSTTRGRSGATVGEDELAEIAVDGYVYGYPLVLMELTRRVMTNVAAPRGAGARAPVNQFAHVASFPDAAFTDVVRPNADTLYSTLFFDVSREPLVIDVPDSDGRYYLLPMLDMWTDVFASPGARTTGTRAQTIVLASADWHGELPAAATLIRSPTSAGFVIGRTQTNGKADLENVHRFQSGISAVPLSAWGHYYEPPAGRTDTPVSKLPPIDQLAALDGETFFALLVGLMGVYAPHANDYPILQRLARIGVVPGRPIGLAHAPAALRRALREAPIVAHHRIVRRFKQAGQPVNGWRMDLGQMGTYGTAYLARAAVAFGGLGANVSADAIYPVAHVDADGRPFDSEARYALRFEADELPPVRAFWSLTLYDDRQLFADNPLGRYAIGDRDQLKRNVDGSLDLLVQRDPPDDARRANWLPAPKSGGFSLVLRLYWPKYEATDGTWQPPPVTRLR